MFALNQRMQRTVQCELSVLNIFSWIYIHTLSQKGIMEAIDKNHKINIFWKTTLLQRHIKAQRFILKDVETIFSLSLWPLRKERYGKKKKLSVLKKYFKQFASSNYLEVIAIEQIVRY